MTQNLSNSYQQLKQTFKRIYHLKSLQGILGWDDAAMMPEGAGQSRAEAMATFHRVIQAMFVNKNNKILIDESKQDTALSAWDAKNLKWMEKQYTHATCIPLKLAESFTKEKMASEQAWRKLRAKNNWDVFLPYLEKTFRSAKEIAERKSHVLGISAYDVLLDQYVPGFNQKNIDAIFSGLKQSIPPLLSQIIQKQKNEAIKIPSGLFPTEKQKNIGLAVMQALRFDFSHGRLDVSHHPMCSGNSDDVRITTRYREDEFLSSLMGICHETGHALYEQGLPKEWMFQPVGHVNSMAMHESQSLFIEMEIGRSLPFFQYVTPLIETNFGKQEAISSDNLFSLVTQVKSGFIRVDADEVTYPMHIILRYEIEKELLSGEISIKDLPSRWNDLMTKYLGISTKDNYMNGVMQDVHWSSGAFGYFPSYTLGRMIAAQLFSTFIKTNPGFFDEIRLGNFQTLHAWLKQHVYDYASLLSTNDFLLKITGEALNPIHFINGLKDRYLSRHTGYTND